MTSKNPMDLARKLHKYQQWVKVSRRGLQVRIDHPNSKKPDLALGTYAIKPNSEYTLLINTDVPQQAENLQVDFYGLDSQNHLTFLNRGQVYQRQRDLRISFATYPKSRYIFLTLKMNYPHSEDEKDKIFPKSSTYNVNYLFLESKQPIARGIETPKIPSSLELEYQIECVPRVIQEINLQPEEFLKEFSSVLPINLDLFEQPLVNYLLQREVSPAYLHSLMKNMKSSRRIKVTQPPPQHRSIQLSEMLELQTEIKKASDKLEKFLLKVDSLANQKSSLEINISQSSHQDTQTFLHQDLQTNIQTHREMEKQLNLKFHHLKSLEQAHQPNLNPNLNPTNHQQTGISDLIQYYQSRILHDLEIIKSQLINLEKQEKQMNQKIIRPKDQTNQNLQDDLDETLLEFRKSRKTCLVIKAHLDEKIAKFVSLFYHYLYQKNSDH